MKLFFQSLIFILLGYVALAQKPNFQKPVDIPIFLNGSFGELRSNHFHTGIDIRTNGQAGLPLYCADDGFVSRISVSPTGYGLALYVDHPSGYTTVYGHLDHLIPELAKWVRDRQYEKKRFSVNLEPEKDQFKVKRGELIGWCGNSGSSGGPHLHFEVRNTRSQRSLNPLTLGFKINDTKSPVIQFLHFYPLSDDSHVAGLTKNSRYKTVLINGSYRPEKTAVYNAYGEIGLGLDVIDYIDGTWSKCGIYRIEIRANNERIYSCSFDSLNYTYTSHFLSYTDYAWKARGGSDIHRNFIEPGNRLELYDHCTDNGKLRIENGKTYLIEYLVTDAAGNASRLVFTIKGTQPTKHPDVESVRTFRYNVSNSYREEQFAINIPEGALFNDLRFQYHLIDSIPRWGYSPIHAVHHNDVPLGKTVSLVLKPKNLPDSLEKKALIVKIESSGQRTSVGGTFRNGWVETNIRSFGQYCISVDNKPPVITPLSIKNNNTLIEANRIRFRITDNLSGIDQYNGYIDDEWVLFGYDAKSNTITYNFDEKLIRNKRHHLVLTVTDIKGNQAEYKGSFLK